MGKLLLLILLSLLAAGGILYTFQDKLASHVINPVAEKKQIFEKPLAKYTFDRLRVTNVSGGSITLGTEVKKEERFISRMFYFQDTGLSGQARKVSGLMNLPTKGDGPFPVIVMNRGFVEREKYISGEGTRRTGEEFAKNGFITLAPDFLGYGESDMPSDTPMEERFQTYTTDLSLLSAIPTLNAALKSSHVEKTADASKVGLWGHSNGGHITLSILAITGKPYPTVLWAPVSKMFPYSILYYTDEFDDHGKALRKVVADFERDYDVEKYSVTNYLSSIRAPISLHQGMEDEEVPVRWSNELSQTLKADGVDIAYATYPGENHNFTQGSWPLAVSRSVAFYKEEFSSASSSATLQ